MPTAAKIVVEGIVEACVVDLPAVVDKAVNIVQLCELDEACDIVGESGADFGIVCIVCASGIPIVGGGALRSGGAPRSCLPTKFGGKSIGASKSVSDCCSSAHVTAAS